MESTKAILEQAREQRRSGDLAGAYASLRQALLAGDATYDFLDKAAELFHRLRKQSSPPVSACQCKVAYLCNHTVTFHLPILELLAWSEGLLLETYAPAYGTVMQEVLNPSSGLYAFKPEVVVIASHWRDAALPAFSENFEPVLQRALDNISQKWTVILEHNPCRIIQHNSDFPAWDSYGALGGRLGGARTAMLRELNHQMAQIAPPQVAILDQALVSANFGRERWEDDRAWHLAKQHPAHAALPILAKAQLALIRAGLGLTKKVLVLDLDNTLWGGVIGEDGLGGIKLGPPDARGEAHQALQQYCRELKDRGILLAVCSKNNPEDARLPFEKHEASVLKLTDFAAFSANWNDKAANLLNMADKLNLGLDSFVLLDDNPVERAQIRARLPMVTVPEIGADPSEFIAALGKGRYFEAWSMSAEDRQRTESYATNVQRESLLSQSQSEADYLRELGMVSEHGPFDETTLPRVAQLVGKTNQFNLTTIRHSLEELRHIAADQTNWTQWFRLRDRFGDFGIIGVIVALADGPDTWRIDTLLMSCRVMGRRMEQFMVRTLFEAAKHKGIHQIAGEYRPTAKNNVVAGIYPAFGFRKVKETSEEVIYDLTVADSQKPASFVTGEALTESSS